MPKKALCWEDVKEGDEAPELVKEKVTRTDIVKYAGASGDFHPMHHDEIFAYRQGSDRGVFAHGMLSGAYLTHLLTDWLGDGSLKKLRLRFATRVWPGDRLTCKGTITSKYQENGENRVDCVCHVENQHGERVTVGAATAVLPAKSSPGQKASR